MTLEHSIALAIKIAHHSYALPYTVICMYSNHSASSANYASYYLRGQSRSAWVGCSAPSVCLSVCPEHNSKTNDPKVFKLGIRNEHGMDILEMTWFGGFKVTGYGYG